ncbi:hypothetical protein BDZ91DRAFT_698134 [Kalaharituber pfeilii]|nr:hypothetical protein BDZ91DRAFT_698134 [Kalaharituber pfeilii]
MHSAAMPAALATITDPAAAVISRLTSSPQAKAATAAAFTTVVILAVFIGLNKAQKETKVRSLKKSIPLVTESGNLTEYGIASQISDEESIRLAGRARKGDFDEEIILEQLARNRVFLGDDGLAKLRSSFIIVVGLGGVGSWAANMLVRSGVSRIRLIDFDQVTLSSLNRHAVARLEDVGTPKVQCMKKALEAVAPWVEIDARNDLWKLDVAEKLLEGNPTFVVDAIDNIDTKVDLLYYCKTHNLPVISSMGAGCKSDPSRICIGDISESTEDPLSRSTRRRLRAKGVTTGIPTVYSTEKPGPGKATLLPLPESEYKKGTVNELGVLPDFRVRILPVLGTMPGFFGLAIANHIVTTIAEYPVDYPAGKNRAKLYADIGANLAGLESRLRGNAPGIRVPLSENDIGYLVEEVFRGKSVVSGFSTRLALVRWLPMKGETRDEGQFALGLGDVVLMTKDEAAKHEELVLKGGKSVEEVYGKEVLERVERFRREEELFRVYR